VLVVTALVGTTANTYIGITNARVMNALKFKVIYVTLATLPNKSACKGLRQTATTSKRLIIAMIPT